MRWNTNTSKPYLRLTSTAVGVCSGLHGFTLYQSRLRASFLSGLAANNHHTSEHIQGQSQRRRLSSVNSPSVVNLHDTLETTSSKSSRDNSSHGVLQIAQTSKRGESTIETYLQLNLTSLSDTSKRSSMANNNNSDCTNTDHDPLIKPTDRVWIEKTTKLQQIQNSSLSQQKNRMSLHGSFLDRVRIIIRDQLAVTFLPKSFPDSVSKEYMTYTFWFFLQCVTGTITGTLSTQALLQALGMGAGASAGLAATTNWLVINNIRMYFLTIYNLIGS
jgi:hypothetical protein